MKKEIPASQPGETTEINWSEVHQRLDLARAAIERGTAPSGDEKIAILKARAAALARPPIETADGETLVALEFLLAGESYGIETRFLREVHYVKEITPLPGTPAFVAGIANVRGEILSVIHLERFFELTESVVANRHTMVIVQNQSTEFGILADDVRGVRSIPLAELQPSLPTLTGIRADYLKGVARNRTALLDTEKLLSKMAQE
jgi:purine-binding chemotaxis protein CheW